MRILKDYGGGKIVRIRAPYYFFSTGGSFGYFDPNYVVFLGLADGGVSPKARKAVSVFWPLFPLYARDFSPVVRRFFCRFPTEQVLYYRNLGLYYGLASTTLPLYAKPRAKVKGGCLSRERGGLFPQ